MNDDQEEQVNLKTKEIGIGVSSVLGLKAELSKREAEYKSNKQKLGNRIQTAQLSKLKNIPTKADRNKGITQRIQKDLREQGELSQIEASWVALQRKTKQYEEMQQGNQDFEENEDLLVDFLQKNIEVSNL
jgi:FtsZ-interacting cell division protein YlmF